MFCVFFFELMSNLSFGLFFKFTCLYFLLVAILNCTNLVTLLFRVIVLIVYTDFICDKNITLSSVVTFTFSMKIHCVRRILWKDILSQQRITQDLTEYIFRLQCRHHQF